VAPGGFGDAEPPARTHPPLHHESRAIAADHPNVARVVAYAKERGVDIDVKRFSGTTRTAEDAARQIGTEVKRIVKSLVFMVKSKPVVVLCSGDNRVSLVRLEEIFRTEDVRRATAEEAKAHTGYAIGGVPPFAYAGNIDLILDEDLVRFDTVWAAAGLPDAVFEISVNDLERLTAAGSAAVAAIPGTQWER
jgi:prolyl-tRNA editing enzyme YbaK/EbsC (Cys-tRNA(Pro) deacylase)